MIALGSCQSAIAASIDTSLMFLLTAEGRIAFSSIAQAGLDNTVLSDGELGCPVTCMLGINNDNGSHTMYAGTADGQVAALKTG